MLRLFQLYFQGVVYPAMHAMIAKWAPPSERSRIALFSYSGNINMKHFRFSFNFFNFEFFNFDFFNFNVFSMFCVHFVFLSIYIFFSFSIVLCFQFRLLLFSFNFDYPISKFEVKYNLIFIVNKTHSSGLRPHMNAIQYH